MIHPLRAPFAMPTAFSHVRIDVLIAGSHPTETRLADDGTMLPLLRAAGKNASITAMSSIEGFRGIRRFAVYGAFKAETTDSVQVPFDRMIHESQRGHIPQWVFAGSLRHCRGHRRMRVVPGQSAGRPGLRHGG
jgi:hypothetical protein